MLAAWSTGLWLLIIRWWKKNAKGMNVPDLNDQCLDLVVRTKSGLKTSIYILGFLNE